MKSSKAIIDLGTNTFHLIIGNIDNGQLKITYKERIYVKLGQGGIDRIQPENYARGMAALKRFQKICADHNVGKITGIGTSALRTAENAAKFVQEAYEKFNVPITIIDGRMEAELIWAGVQLTGVHLKNALVVDVGGGSVECIWVHNDAVEQIASLPLGIARLANLYPNAFATESLDDARQLEEHIKTQSEEILKSIPSGQNMTFVGSAGTFELLELLPNAEQLGDALHDIPLVSVRDWYVDILKNPSKYHRDVMKIPAERLDYISYAATLIKCFLQQVTFNQFLISKYALKEGALFYF